MTDRWTFSRSWGTFLRPSGPSQRLAQLNRRLSDPEMDEDDLDEEERDRLMDGLTEAAEMEPLRMEIAALQELLSQARRVKDHAADSNLDALKRSLAEAEFRELADGRGKLLIFTEHRDTMNYLLEHLHRWEYSTCGIRGGMNPHERKRAQEEFRMSRQVCVATEAAGEGINLQFCRLMINYDMPWNPTRLEQRLGRIHRIGQERDVHVFNFVAVHSEEGQPVIEGRILQRLLAKLDAMRKVLADRVFDVIGEILALNDVNLPEMLREAAHDPRRLDEYLDRIERIDPAKVLLYEKATGIALARAHVDFSSFQRADMEGEKRRLMPRYVEQHFIDSCTAVGVKVEQRADGLWRVERVPADLRSERRASVRRLGRPDAEYRKITFHKEQLDQDRHLDAVPMGPGHPLYAAVDESLNESLAETAGGAAVFLDPESPSPYRLFLFEMSIRGQDTKAQTIHGELIAVREDSDPPTEPRGRFSIVHADCLLDLPAHPTPPGELGNVDPAPAADFLKSTYQMAKRSVCQEERRK